MMPKNKTFLIVAICLSVFLGVSLINQVVAQDSGSSETPSNQDALNPDGLDAEGKVFELGGITITSSEIIQINCLEAITKTFLTFCIEPVTNTATETILTISYPGFANLNRIRWQDGYVKKEESSFNSQGKYQYTQDISQPHRVLFQPVGTGTIYVTGSPGETIYLKDIAPEIPIRETVVVASDGIIVDGSDAPIIGLGWGFGIIAYNRTGVQIINSTVQNFNCGIQVDFGSSNILTNNTSLENDRGICFYKSSNNILTGNKMLDNTFNFGLWATSDSHVNHTIDTTNTVDGKSIYYIKNKTGKVYDNSTLPPIGTIYCINCDNITVKDLELTKNGQAIYFWKTNGTPTVPNVIKNVDANNNGFGILLNYSSYNTIANTITSGPGQDYGISLFNSHHNTLTGNTANNNTGYGFWFNSSSYNNLTGNTTNNTQFGINFEPYCNYNNLTNNIANENRYGISINSGSSNILTRNIANGNNHYGIMISNSEYNQLIGNITNSNVHGGIRLWSSSNNTLTKNYAALNRYGIFLRPDWFPCSNNTLEDNITINNIVGIGLFSGAKDNILRDNTVTLNDYGLYLGKSQINRVYHNNIYNNNEYNASSIDWRPTRVPIELPPAPLDYPAQAIQLSYNDQGNFWGHTGPPGFHRFGIDAPPYDSHHPQVVDSWPYLVKNGWDRGYSPGQWIGVNQPPECDVLSPEAGEHVDGTITITFLVKDAESNTVTVTAWVNGVMVGSTTLTATPGGVTGTISFDPTLLGIPEGEYYYVIIECSDGVNGPVTDIGADTFTIDTTPPVILFFPPVIPLTFAEDSFVNVNLTPFKSDNLTPLDQLTWSIQNIIPVVNTTPPAGTFNVSVVDDMFTISAPADVNGTGGSFDLVLTDLAGLTDSRTVLVTINAFNDAPTVDLTIPDGYEVWGALHPAVPTDITYKIYEVEGDTVTVDLYYNINDGTWFKFDTVTITPPPSTLTTYTYTWDVTGLLDDNRYKVRVEASDAQYTDADRSANFFTIDNQPLLIDPLVPDPQVINPSFGETTLLPFELSEPADNVTVSVIDPDGITIISTIAGGLIDAGVRSVPWDGIDPATSQPAAPGNYTFQITAIERDSLGTILSTPTVTSDQANVIDGFNIPVEPAGEYVRIKTGKPVIADLAESLDPFSPSIGETTQISFRLFMLDPPPPDIEKLITTITITDEVGNNIRVTPPFYFATIPGSTAGKLYDTPPDPPLWDGTDINAQIVPPGIYQYTITARRIAGGSPETKFANPKSGVITVIDAPNTDITSFEDITVYAPAGIGISIAKNPVIPAEAGYSLQNLAIFGNYLISPLYNITPDTPVPAIIIFKYDPNLSPEAITLWQFDPDLPGFVQVNTAFIDRANNQIIAEVMLSSLFGLLVNKDITAPLIEDLALTPQILNFTVKDDLRGINISAIKVVLDDEDITDELTFIGQDGDLSVNVSGEDIFIPNLDTHTLIIIAQDMAGNEVRESISFSAGFAQVKLVLKPEALKVNPGILTAYLKFPAPFGIPITIEATLDGAPFEEWTVSYEDMPEEGLEAPIVVMKFRRADIEKARLDTEFILKGTFDDGTAPFGQPYDLAGHDSISKIIAERSDWKESRPTKSLGLGIRGGVPTSVGAGTVAKGKK